MIIILFSSVGDGIVECILSLSPTHPQTPTHTHTYIYIYIYLVSPVLPTSESTRHHSRYYHLRSKIMLYRKLQMYLNLPTPSLLLWHLILFIRLIFISFIVKKKYILYCLENLMTHGGGVVAEPASYRVAPVLSSSESARHHCRHYHLRP